MASKTHRKPAIKKAKPMIPPICLHNVDSASFDITEPTLSHMHQASHTATSFKLDSPSSGRSNLFNRSDPPLPDHKKTDEEPMGKFLWRGVCYHIDIKDSLPK